MSRTKYYIQDGFIVKKYNNDDKDVPGLFSIDKLFKKMFDRYHVAYFDDCCDVEGTATGDKKYLPARFDIANNKVEYYNGTEYVDIATAPTTTTTTHAPTTTTTTNPVTTTTTTT